MATKLYPPIIEEVLPAFYQNSNGYTISIPFEMNKTVGYVSIAGFALKLRTILGGTSVLKNNEIISTVYDQKTNKVIFTITSADLMIQKALQIYEGQFYKAQIAYVALDGTIGYYSTVGMIKCVAKPSIMIENCSTDKINLLTNSYIGKYIQNSTIGDCSEKVYSYIFNMYDKDYNLFATSDEQIHDISQDDAENFSTDSFILKKSVTPYEVYYIQYCIKTVNNLQLNSPLYHISATETLEITNEVHIIPQNQMDNGYILISFEDDKTSSYVGMYLLSHSSDNGLTWNEVERFEVTLDQPQLNKYKIKDYLIEQGKTYIYSLQEFNKYNVYTDRIMSNPIYADYEDMYLQDKNRILKIRFNPKVSSFKNNIPEQKIETIGSKYPFIFRNGNVYYKEFPISGLLSFQLDTMLEFLTPEEQEESGILATIDHRKYTGELNQWQEPRVMCHLDKQLKTGRISTDLIAENMYTERYFKLKVLEWLNNGQPKLFKSPTEGLYIVRLLNVSLSPEDKLNRMLHTFNSTAYEVAEVNFDNLINLNLVTDFVSSPLVESFTNSFSLKNYVLFNYSSDANTNGRSFISYLAPLIKNLHFTDFCPGDEIIITYEDGSSNSFIIGASTELHLDKEERIAVDVRIKPNQNYSKATTFNRIITYTYEAAATTNFDHYTSVDTMALPCLHLPYHAKKIVYELNENESLNANTEELASFSAADFTSSKIANADELKKYLGYSFYLDNAHTKPKAIIKHIDQIIVTKRQIVPVYKNPSADEYLLNVFGTGFLNDRTLLQTVSTDPIEVKFNRTKTGDLPFSELRKKDGIDVFTFKQLMKNFQDDRFTIIQIYEYKNNKWQANNNAYYIPFENIGAFSLTANDWRYEIEGQDFLAIPNSYNEGQIQDDTVIINTSTYQKVINIDRFNTLVPSIKAGHGVCIDIIPQILIYNYEVETSNSTIRTAKQAFLEDKTLSKLYTYLKSLKGQ